MVAFCTGLFSSQACSPAWSRCCGALTPYRPTDVGLGLPSKLVTRQFIVNARATSGMMTASPAGMRAR